MNTPSQMLQFVPITAPGSTCANAQTFVPAPMFGVSTMACGCWKWLVIRRFEDGIDDNPFL